jgi:hypothetical protein
MVLAAAIFHERLDREFSTLELVLIGSTGAFLLLLGIFLPARWVEAITGGISF